MPRTWLANLVLLVGAGTGAWMAVGALSQIVNPPLLGGVGAVSSALGAELFIWLALGIATFVLLRRAVRWHVMHTRLAWCCALTTIVLLGIAIGVGVWSYTTAWIFRASSAERARRTPDNAINRMRNATQRRRVHRHNARHVARTRERRLPTWRSTVSDSVTRKPFSSTRSR